MLDEIVEGLSRDYGVHPYAKWRGAHWRLASLVEPRRFPTIDGRVRRCASQERLALYNCCLGLKRPGSKGSNVEAVDWGTTATEVLTARAGEVLAAGHRL